MRRVPLSLKRDAHLLPAIHRRNCAFYTSGHKALLSSDKDSVRIVTSTGPLARGINILPAILLPLAGPEEFDLDVGNNSNHYHKPEEH